MAENSGSFIIRNHHCSNINGILYTILIWLRYCLIILAIGMLVKKYKKQSFLFMLHFFFKPVTKRLFRGFTHYKSGLMTDAISEARDKVNMSRLRMDKQ